MNGAQPLHLTSQKTAIYIDSNNIISQSFSRSAAGRFARKSILAAKPADYPRCLQDAIQDAIQSERGINQPLWLKWGLSLGLNQPQV